MRKGLMMDGLAWVSRSMSSIGSVVLIAMMLVTTVDVIGRYIFNSPLTGANEIAEYLQVLVVYFGIAYTAVQKGHVAVDVLFNRLPQRGQGFLISFVSLAGAALFAVIAWESIVQSLVFKAAMRSSPVLDVPVWPFVLVVAFGSGILSLVLLSDFIGSFRTGSDNRREIWLRAFWVAAAAVLASAVFLWLYRLPKVSPITAGILGLVLLVLLLLTRMPVGFVMATVGFLGASYIRGAIPALGQMGRLPYVTPANYDWTAISLFVLMGFLALHSGMGSDLYRVVYTWMGRLPGGLATATIGGCAGFAAISGDSLSTAVTMGTVALPEMKAYKYSPSLAAGCVAAGGTLGVLIPPSIVFIIYGMLTEQSIGRLFIAGILPGILVTCLFIAYITIRCRLDPTLGPRGPRTTMVEKLVSLRATWRVIVLFGLVIGGIYFGVFTPTEAGAIGAFGALLAGLTQGKLTWKNFATSVVEAGKVIAMTFIILIGAFIFNLFLSLSKLPMEFANFIVGLNAPGLVVLILIYIVYIILGCLISGLALITLTVPIFYPMILALGYDPIWFGVMIVLTNEMAVITPPVGINVYGIAGVAKDIPMETIFRGILPFFLVLLLALAILTVFPQIATFLPSLMK
ncbi:MAG: TRAP transporter large permease subunit [Pseudomonadota bacterium]